MINYRKSIVCLLLFLFSIPCLSYGYNLKNYKAFYGVCITGTKDTCIVLRSFTCNNKRFFLIVNPRDLHTSIVTRKNLLFSEEKWENLIKRFGNTVYFKALLVAENNSNPYQNAGITHINREKKGINLTIDLCPSHKPLDRLLFTKLYSELGFEEKPVPMAISVSGLWMLNHHDDLEWLIKKVKDKEIIITWINHSYYHRTSKSLPLKNNFLLEKGTNIDTEILKTEQEMIENDITPSVFFRFPGLVSDNTVFKRVISYGLIPVGSDAWLAKDQLPKDGSIVLLHANGNEPVGITRFFQLLTSERDSIIGKQWYLYDLRESIIEEDK